MRLFAPGLHPAIPLAAGASYLPGLDGLRAIAILIVLLAHIGFDKLIPGGFGVTVFFFVSGFLITRILVADQKARGGGIDLRGFYVRRFLRLMPALLVFFVVSGLLLVPFGGAPHLAHVVAGVLYGMNYYDLLSSGFGWPQRIVPWGHLWSLAVEEHFYLLFPAALALFGRTHAARIGLVGGAIVVSALWRVAAIHGLGLSADWTYSATDSRLESIAWGCLLAILMDGVPRQNARIRWLVSWPAVGSALFLVAFTLVFRDDSFRATWRYTAQGAALFVLLLNLYGLRDARFALDWLEWPQLRWIGRLSYSLYLWHMPVIWVLWQISGTDPDAGERLHPALMLAAVLLSFGFAMASYYGVEKPLFGLRKRFGGKPVEELAGAGQHDPAARVSP